MQKKDKKVVPGLTVRIDDPRDFNRALRQWKKKVDESKVLVEYREREYYTKPSDARKKAKAAAKARHRRQVAKTENKFKRNY